MNDWGFAQTDPSQQLARLHYFSVTKQQEGTEIEFVITVKEYYTPKDPRVGANHCTKRSRAASRKFPGSRIRVSSLSHK